MSVLDSCATSDLEIGGVIAEHTHMFISGWEELTSLEPSPTSPFSQFHPAVFEVAGVKYKCAEQYMMHQKAVLFHDKEIAGQILTAEKPGQMKKLGRKVRNFDDAVWKENRQRIIKEGSMAKYSQNTPLMEELFKTRGTYMVEASPRDCVYGIGLGASNPKAKDPKNWRGKNLLGNILTDVRETLIARQEEEECGEISGSTGKQQIIPDVEKDAEANSEELPTASSAEEKKPNKATREKESHESLQPKNKKRKVET